MDIQNALIWAKIFIWVSIISLLWFFIYTGSIVIEITEESKYEGLLFAILNGLIGGMYLNVCGFGLKSIQSKSTIKFTILAFIIWMTVQGFGFWGLRFTFNVNHFLKFDLFQYKVYESNSPKGIRFFTYNWYIFTVLWFLSFPLESDPIH